jgi:hypothetical protein
MFRPMSEQAKGIAKGGFREWAYSSSEEAGFGGVALEAWIRFWCSYQDAAESGQTRRRWSRKADQ